MFNHGIKELLTRLPEFEGLDGALARRLLSSAYAETLSLADGPTASGRGDAADVQSSSAQRQRDLRRLATALEVHAILNPDVDPATTQACAFVAAEALSLLDDRRENADRELAQGKIDHRRYRQLQCGLLYMIAGYDANAASVARELDTGLEVHDALPSLLGLAAQKEDCVAALRSFLQLRLPTVPAVWDLGDDAAVEDRLRAEFWRRIAEAAQGHIRWLQWRDDADISPAHQVLEDLIQPLRELRAGAYADVAHLARLLKVAIGETDERAARRIPPPQPGGGWTSYLKNRSRARPLLWPGARAYVAECLPGPSKHAVVAVPTGGGKSAVAEIAVAQALSQGWVLYLAPTNALVAQVQRDLSNALRHWPDAVVRGFAGGPELVLTAEEAIEAVGRREVLVMTPEKCSLALRQRPETFADLSLCVLDECHLLGESGTRGVLAELVLAHVMTLAPSARLLLLSALMSNPEELATWLNDATGHGAVPVAEPWRPTRTLRAVAGFDGQRGQALANEAGSFLQDRPNRVRREFSAPIALLAGLQGAWEQTAEKDFALVPTGFVGPLAATREGDRIGLASGTSYVNKTAAAISTGLVEQGHRVLTFLPRSRHDSFSVAATIQLEDTELEAAPKEVEHHIAIAEAELGAPSAVKGLLDHGVAVHTSAMLDDEQRATERAFRAGSARVMFATSTLAQGLNLPATAVVIGGTRIAGHRGGRTAESDHRTRTQLLNAVGRAGRPRVASRSLAIVVPDKPVTFPTDWTSKGPARAREAVWFLEDEDAASPVVSQLDSLILRALRDDPDTEGMTATELAAFAVLPLDQDGARSAEIVRHSFGAWVTKKNDQRSAQIIAGSLSQLGQTFLGDRPGWIADAAYLAGLEVQSVVALYDGLMARSEPRPSTPTGWVKLTLILAEQMSHDVLLRVISPDNVKSSQLKGIHSASTTDRVRSWEAFRDVSAKWMSGAVYGQIAAAAIGPTASRDVRRHQQAPLPKVIRIVDQALRYDLTRLVGGVLALHEVPTGSGVEEWSLEPVEREALQNAPLALRVGCATEDSLAWHRIAGAPRRLAHVLATHLPIGQRLLNLAPDETATTLGKYLDEQLGDASWPEITATDRQGLLAWNALRTTDRSAG